MKETPMAASLSGSEATTFSSRMVNRTNSPTGTALRCRAAARSWRSRTSLPRGEPVESRRSSSSRPPTTSTGSRVGLARSASRIGPSSCSHSTASSHVSQRDSSMTSSSTGTNAPSP